MRAGRSSGRHIAKSHTNELDQSTNQNRCWNVMVRVICNEKRWHISGIHGTGCLGSSQHQPPYFCNEDSIERKREGERKRCDNYRGIFLLSVAGKVLARVMRCRLLNHVVDVIPVRLPSPRSTTDMIFVVRLLQENLSRATP